MRFTALIAATAVAVSGVAANPLNGNFDLTAALGYDLTPNNHYGAPLAPWVPGAHAGWYNGKYPNLHPHYPCLGLGGIICRILRLFPHALQCPHPAPPTPPPSDGYHQTFSNLTGATQAGDYLTYGLVDTVADCKAMCNGVSGCTFVNTYHDVNGKDGSTQLTCSLFSSCHTASDATNLGGQTQPDGTIDYITNSDGWCKA